MSDDRIKNIDRSVIDSMSIATLQALLRDDFENPDGILDEETRLYVMQVLTEKEKAQGAEIPDAEAALSEFRSEYLPMADSEASVYDEESNIIEFAPKKKKLRRPAIRILAAMIAVVLLGTVTASATNFDLWSKLVNWTKQTFGFNEQVQVNEDEFVAEQLNEMAEDMKEHGITPYGLLPSYMPEGYVAEEGQTQCLEIDNMLIFIVPLTKGDSTIMVKYTIYTDGNMDSSAVYSKDDGEPEEYKIGTFTHYIMTNAGKYFTVWRDENMECGIAGVDTRDELIKIIDSIYVDTAAIG